MINPEEYLSEEAVVEFDRIVREYESPLRRKRTLRWAAGIAAAAAVALAVILPLRKTTETPLSPVVIAEGIGHLMDINSGMIESINAVPKGSKALVTLKMKDGKEYCYMMTYDKDSGATSLVAVNDNPKRK